MSAAAEAKPREALRARRRAIDARPTRSRFVIRIPRNEADE
jgi:hypothetical protein